MKKKSQIPNKRLGIIGGGQLARMLGLEASPLGLQVHILSEKETDPAAQITHHWFKGNPQSEKDQIEFIQSIDLLTFESEFIDMDLFEKLENSPSTDLVIYPKPSLMKTLQDRSSQKNILNKHKLPTAKFLEIKSLEDLDRAYDLFNGHFVLKKCRGGYDGYGTYYCRSVEDLAKLQSLFPAHFIAEEFVPFQKELAVILARSFDGSIIHLPLVQSHQVDSRCDWVQGPVKHSQLKSLISKLKKFLQKTDYVGVIAFELFDTGKNLYINEIAPRVHNSGHYSQDGLRESQFLLHLQCGLGLRLKEPQQIEKSFAMINLIGSQNLSLDQMCLHRDLNGKLHWYGKTETRKGRKMGHLNYTGKDPKKLIQMGLKERKKFQL